jgi:D-arginine dehydrogenase
VLDIHALTSLLASVARERGVVIESRSEVTRVEVSAGSVQGVALRDGTRLAAQHVVLAAGAWGAELGRACAAPLPLQPMRRHLVVLRAQSRPSAMRPVVWRLEDEIYYRPESSGWLASPCDETPASALPQPSDPAALVLLAQKLARLAPRLAAASVVQRSWACLRTFAPDREIVAGPDPRLRGLHWFGALGGRGMSIAPAAGEWVAQGLLGDAPHPLSGAVAVSRLLEASAQTPRPAPPVLG